jgi:hypothetical protein
MDTQQDRLGLIVRKTHRVPLPAGPAGDGAAIARQLDVALIGIGWKLSADLLSRLSALDADAVLDIAASVMGAARRVVGDHVRHNSYFMHFPDGVPDTVEFWTQLVTEALTIPATAEHVHVEVQLAEGWLNLRSLPGYGKYQHSWEEMIAAHGEFIPAASDRFTILHAGEPLGYEIQALYLSLAGSRVPLSEDDAAVLADLALECAPGPQPDVIPVRENRALINRVRLAGQMPLLADTVTDVLRLAAVLSGGDVSLVVPAKLRSFRRPERRALLGALDAVIEGNSAKLGDVNQYAERWKRLGERLHPHEHPFPYAADVFAVARGEKRAPSLMSRVEAAFADGEPSAAAEILANAPGLFFRSVDRLLRTAETETERGTIIGAARGCAPKASARVLLSLREHLVNRVHPTDVSRVFAGKSARATASADVRPPLGVAAVEALTGIIDTEIASRLAINGPVLVDPAIREVALPLSGKAIPDGIGIMPRGSVSLITGEILRFFCYWQQEAHRTDYDLSVLMLDEMYSNPEHVSWTNNRTSYATYSGDIVEAPFGATEFIDIRLPAVTRRFILPQVNVYCGEKFDEAEESFFGFMLRERLQDGAPFEARTVRAKSGMRGAGNVALPVAFMRGEDGKWRAKWLHLYLRGEAAFNLVEGNHVSASTLTRAIIEREYLTVGWLTDLASGSGAEVTVWDGVIPDKPVTFIGLERPEGLPEDSRVITLQNLSDLIPE